MLRVLHISNSKNSDDGGIYFYIRDLIKYQNKSFIDCHWLTTKNQNSLIKKKELLKKIRDIDPTIIHIHGVWTLGTRLIPQLKKITNNIIVSPHGMLNHESFRKTYLGKRISLNYLKKRLYLFLVEKKNLNQIKYFHASRYIII